MSCDVHTLLSQLACEYDRLKMQNATLLGLASSEDPAPDMRHLAETSSAESWCAAAEGPRRRIETDHSPRRMHRTGDGEPRADISIPLQQLPLAGFEAHAAASLFEKTIDAPRVACIEPIVHVESEYTRVETDFGSRRNVSTCDHAQSGGQPVDIFVQGRYPSSNSSLSLQVVDCADMDRMLSGESAVQCQAKQLSNKSDDMQSTSNVTSKSTTVGSNADSTTHKYSHAALHEIWNKAIPRYELRHSGTHVSHLSVTSQPTQKSFHFVELKKHGTGVKRALTDMTRAGDAVTSESSCQRLVLRPNCRARTVWDLLTTILIVLDVCMIPLQVVFDIGAPTFDNMFNWLTIMFWSCDLSASFFVGYHINGFVEMRPKKIALRYIKTWFLTDLILISLDWFVLACPTSVANLFGLLRTAKILRVFRVIRAFRLLRTMKVLLKVFAFLDDLFISGTMAVVLDVVRLICFVAMAAHFIACGWFAIGKFGEGDGHSWVSHLKANSGDREVLPVGYFYTTAMHWALTQFTPASMEVVPRNWLERTYAICVLLFGLVTFSSMISSITTSMTRLRNLKAEETRKLDDVYKYVTQSKTTLELSSCIFSYLRHHRSEQRKRLHMKDVDFLSILPQSLRGELHVETFAPAVMAHPLFKCVAGADENFIVALCQSAISERFIAKDESLFARGDQCKHMWHVSSGNLRYDLGPADRRLFKNMREGAFVSEIALWVAWTYQGRTTAKKSTEVLTFDADAIHDIATYAEIFPELQKYARFFVGQIRCSGNTLFEATYENELCMRAVRSIFQPLAPRRSYSNFERLEQMTMFQSMKQVFTKRFQHGRSLYSHQQSDTPENCV